MLDSETLGPMSEVCAEQQPQDGNITTIEGAVFPKTPGRPSSDMADIEPLKTPGHDTFHHLIKWF